MIATVIEALEKKIIAVTRASVIDFNANGREQTTVIPLL
jgi:hypothetical protein